jgi:ATP-dependent Clp protease ATP-binding subunit ClpB
MSALRSPAWFRELEGALAISPQVVLEGDVHDRYLLPTGDGETERVVVSLVEAVWMCLERAGFEAMVVADPADGVRAHPGTEAAMSAASEVLGRGLTGTGAPRSAEGVRDDLLAVVRAPRQVALVVELAPRFALNPEQLSREEQALFVAAERAALTARPLAIPSGERHARRQVPLFNTVIWIVDRDRDLPAWLVSHEDHVRSIAVPRPDYGQRERCSRRLLSSLPGWEDATDHRRDEIVARLVGQTDGMTLTSLFSITLLATDVGIGLDGIEDAARAYRVGVVDNPWRTADLHTRLETAAQDLDARVLGQSDAVRKALDILMRAATGLTGAHGSPYGTRPRGTLFFAGPTGVGKTELAKQLTRIVFGDERAYIRFDMSEFSAEHAADRLIGAPPGYVGFAAGGELTNAIRERPFSLVLFDEIEKAHPRILDKFLQVLEDGRLTDGRGATVYFTEAVLVFTSNLGLWIRDGEGGREPNVTRDTPRDEAERRIREAIQAHFTEELGRPELLNRFGDGIVVFDFIDDTTASAILDLLVSNVAARVEREHGAALELTPVARQQLVSFALRNLDNGGRGVGTVVENALVNPLARRLFSEAPTSGRLRIDAVVSDGRTYDVEVSSE